MTSSGCCCASSSVSSTIGCADRQAAAVRHGVARVHGEIREGVLELLRVAGDDRRFAVELEVDGDVRAQNATEQRPEIPDDLIEIDRLDTKHLAAAERDEPLGQGRGSFDRGADRLQVGPNAFVLFPSSSKCATP